MQQDGIYDNRRYLKTSLNVVLEISPLLLNITFTNDSSMAAANILFPLLAHFALLIFFFLILAVYDAYKN